ncbi:MAG: NifU family protein [Oligoflexales bacterium]
MSNVLNSVVFSKKPDDSWQAVHVPSGKTTHGLTKEEAETAMLEMLGLDDTGQFSEPQTSDRFEGVAREIAEYLEGPVSEMLKMHSGFARLEAYDSGVAHIRLGGGCRGCPSSLITLSDGVKSDLQHKYGEEVILDVIPVLE